MTKLGDIVDLALLDDQINAGNIRVQLHPQHKGLRIANYTDQVAFNRDWNDATRLCRGLIWNADTGEVLARPFPKFFNWDEPEAPRILDDQVVWHWDNKYDGSLGIGYLDPEGMLRLATRGSFASDQAHLGSELINTPDYDAVYDEACYMIYRGYTPLFEICGPDNRIVLTYDENFLAPLGYMHIASGRFTPAPSAAKGGNPRTMRSLLGDLSRSRAEGWVVWLSNTKPLKIKQADYIELHRIVSNLSVKEVWRQLRAGTFFDFVIKLPDEWQGWATGIADDLRAKFVARYNQAEVQYKIVSRLQSVGGEFVTRKGQAEWITTNLKPELRGLVFSRLDGKPITDAIWRQLEPKGNETG